MRRAFTGHDPALSTGCVATAGLQRKAQSTTFRVRPTFSRLRYGQALPIALGTHHAKLPPGYPPHTRISVISTGNTRGIVHADGTKNGAALPAPEAQAGTDKRY